ncbi:type VI secretion system tip protein VgrG [Kosakonia sp. ML.JS2a]|uniref:type VI secretion system Vgr family protein n=1 Tax=Kosakonia sp. ML.JS2a TaxID=2980557 RepID=UPI0021D8CE6F|nr:type VI secretion system tip protein TssI/VgrG [Kosakonia sp. ML.JS2a]UXY10935.1 type VI secretion system tip protein VgrG [Kosakonia sp. ML.JS2a]
MSSRITVKLTAAPDLLFWKMAGSESLSEPFEYQLTVLGEDARTDRSQILGQSVSVEIPGQGTLATRYLNGKATSVAVASVELSGQRYAAYQLTVESDLWPMRLERNMRIFQAQTVPQIVQTLLTEHGVKLDNQLTASYRIWEYCVQYQESSLDFIRRLMELEGISWYFRHTADSHTLVLTDAGSAFPAADGYDVIPYIQTPAGGVADVEGISQWSMEDRVTPGIFSTEDYDFRKPNAWLFQARQNPASPSPGRIDVYEWPGRFVEQNDGEYYARIKQERWQVDHQQTTGTATAIGIAAGHTFQLINAPFTQDNGRYLVTKTWLQLEENRYASGDEGDSSRLISFSVIPASLTWRPEQKTAWPRTYGPQTARVVGPEGEPIWTDKYGRVKVKFHWDRLGKSDETSSCWVRVSSAWAGQGFGGVQIPRVGDEVVIDFINGDPDRPMVTGRVYNEANMPPWALPAAATVMGFMTRSKTGNCDNASYLLFEDKLGSERVDLHAEKDMNVSVENNQVITVDGNRSLTVLGELDDEVTKRAGFKYHATRTTEVTDKETRTVGNGEETSITNGRVMRVTSGGETVTVKGNRTEDIDGTSSQHITGLVSYTFDNGVSSFITGSRQETISQNLSQTITGNNITTIEGAWTQKIAQGATISSPKLITIASDEKVHIKTPQALEYKDHKETVSLFSFDFTALKVVTEGASFTATAISKVGLTNLKFDKSAFDLASSEGRVAFTHAMMQYGQVMASVHGLTMFM